MSYIVIIILFLLLIGGLCGYLFACLRRRELFDQSLLPPDNPRAVYLRQCEAGASALKELRGEDMSLLSSDGKRLVGKLYSGGQKDRFIILVHGYHSCPEYDFGTIAHFYLAMGYGVLLTTQRAHGESEGMLITYGAMESDDLKKWCELLVKEYPQSRIILHGISMGGATVMLATELGLPENVVGIIDDCGYTRPFDEIAHVAKTGMNLPRLAVHLANIWSMILTGTSFKKPSVTRAGARCPLPKLYIHGDADTFVPYEMGLANYNAAMPPKRFVSVKGAGHALCFFIGEKEVTEEIARFTRENLP